MNTTSITRKQTSFHLSEDPLKRHKHKTKAIDKLEEFLKLLVNVFLYLKKAAYTCCPAIIVALWNAVTLLRWWNKEEYIIKLVGFGYHSELL